MENGVQLIETIKERDIDLILLEELSVDNTFCEWLVKELDLPKLTKVNGTWHSISDFGLGETDILFSYNSEDKRIYVLIENKIDALFQDEQFNRYQKRGQSYVDENECDRFESVLIAPKMYCENQSYFENYITYEAIVDRLSFTGSKRNLFKKELFEIAINKLHRGYSPVNSIPVQKFWLSYWEFKQEKFSDLSMKKPGIVPHNSDWPMLYDKNLKNIVFYHKLAQGNADVTFKGFSKEDEFKIKEELPEWVRFEKHSKSFSLRLFSGKVDRTKEFSEQIEIVEKGLKNLIRIRDWIKSNRTIYNIVSK